MFFRNARFAIIDTLYRISVPFKFHANFFFIFVSRFDQRWPACGFILTIVNRFLSPTREAQGPVPSSLTKIFMSYPSTLSALHLEEGRGGGDSQGRLSGRHIMRTIHTFRFNVAESLFQPPFQAVRGGRGGRGRWCIPFVLLNRSLRVSLSLCRRLHSGQLSNRSPSNSRRVDSGIASNRLALD